MDKYIKMNSKGQLIEISRLDDELLDAVFNSSLPRIESALKNGANPNGLSLNGVTSMFIACQSTDFGIIAGLLDHGGDHSAALEGAVTGYRVETLNFLLRRGVDIEASDAGGNTAIFAALHHDDLDMLKLLINKGAKADVIRQDGKSLLDVAQEFNKQAATCIEEHLLKIASLKAASGFPLDTGTPIKRSRI